MHISLWIPAFAGMTVRGEGWPSGTLKSPGEAIDPHSYPVSRELSLRAKRGNPVAGRAILRVTRSPRRYAPRDDKLGTREAIATVDSAHAVG